ncbi:zf-DNL-domain-containing protein [Sistotremastrum suecicum HHB10207 ss-3]|uniref:Zf-DNL-domain-containing protein n=1 Tax=Sistotremastrum suecicum HHB10207 ss-3 TaxID=1314776 RepID=A0A166CYJ3_9AGAM|nr:zf-DNL-domain-containing protein [Sistotremastrum suecicum HHB10207 ss-3]
MQTLRTFTRSVARSTLQLSQRLRLSTSLFRKERLHAQIYIRRPFGSTISRWHPAIIPGESPEEPEVKIQPKLSLTFTCTVADCGHRSTHEFKKASYERGIVIVECPSCKNRHLIADHLGWFKESTQGGQMRTVEDLMKAKGEKVRRGRLDAGGVVEYVDDES